MAEDIDTRVSPSLHPAGFDAIAGLDDQTKPYIADAVSAFRDAYISIGKIHDATAAGKRNTAWTDEQRMLMVGKEAARQQDRLCRKLDAVTATLERNIAAAERELSQPLRERAALGNLNQEVRQHCRGLKPDERAKLLHEALEAGDNDTLQAILGAQPFLSGMSAAEQALYLHRYHERNNPALVGRLAVMRGAMEKLGRDATSVIAEVQKAVGAPPAKVNAIDAANEAALAALKIEPTV